MKVFPTISEIMVAGDWHGNFSWASRCLRVAQDNAIDLILQVGDFGYWEHIPEGKYYLDKLSENAVLRGVNVVWLDGNHENHTVLREKYGDVVSDEGFWKIRENVWYSPRANAWNWWGKRLATVGGAVSIDKEYRVLGKSWWAEEMLNSNEMRAAMEIGKVDYLFTHDGPENFPAPLWKLDETSAFSRSLYTKIGQAVRPSKWFHGHYHRRLTYPFPRYDSFCEVECLDMDGEFNNTVKFDLLTAEVSKVI